MSNVPKLDSVPCVTANSPAEISAAAHTAAVHAHGPDDLRLLLAILGIRRLPLPPRDPVHNRHTYRKGCRCAKCVTDNVASLRERRQGRIPKYGYTPGGGSGA